MSQLRANRGGGCRMETRCVKLVIKNTPNGKKNSTICFLKNVAHMYALRRHGWCRWFPL
jgi:hypothetical protein